MKNENQTQETSKVQGFIANTQVYLNKERETITHRLGDDLRIEMPVNLYKQILGIPFEKKTFSKEEAESTSRRNVFGLVARPAIYLSKDGQYLIHRVLGIRVSKHINYYKQILGAEYQPKASQSLPA
ncbi:MAG TPA: hypothetical protein VF412_05185 [Bdellovibrio sp.]|uniref:hypothetical protein n=1 Tax=Bdellovibrio sp. TaxID=28201 RepID=UPI002F014189